MVSLADSCASDLRSKEVASFVVPAPSRRQVSPATIFWMMYSESVSAPSPSVGYSDSISALRPVRRISVSSKTRARRSPPVASALAYAVVVNRLPPRPEHISIFARSRSVRGSRAASGVSQIRAPNPQPPDVERVSPSLERRAASPTDTSAE